MIKTIFYFISFILDILLFSILIIYLFKTVRFIIKLNLAVFKSGILFIISIINSSYWLNIKIVSFLFDVIIHIILFNPVFFQSGVLFIILVIDYLRLLNKFIVNFIFDTIVYINIFNTAYFKSGALFIILLVGFLFDIISSTAIFNLSVLFNITFRIRRLIISIIILRSVFIKISI